MYNHDFIPHGFKSIVFFVKQHRPRLQKVVWEDNNTKKLTLFSYQNRNRSCGGSSGFLYVSLFISVKRCTESRAEDNMSEED